MNTNARVVTAAALLALDLRNPETGAFNRMDRAKSERRLRFWRDVLSLLYRPARCQGWTNDDLAAWNAIRGRQVEILAARAARLGDPQLYPSQRRFDR